MTLAHGICVLLIINYATEVTPCLKCALKTLKENFLVGRKCAYDGYINNDHVSSVGTNKGPCGNQPKYSSEESQWKEEFSDEKSVFPTSLKKIRISKDGKEKIIISQKQAPYKLYTNKNKKPRKLKWRGGTIQSEYQSSETEYKMDDLPKIKILGGVSNDEEFVKEINTNKKRKNNKLFNEKPNKRIGYEYQIKEKQSKQSSRDLQSNKLEGLEEGKSIDDGEYRKNVKNFGKSELIKNSSNYKECTKLSKGPCKMITSEMKEDSQDTHIEFISNDQPDQYKDLKQQESQPDDVNNKNMRTESRIEAQSQHEIETHNSRNETVIHNNIGDKHQEANGVDLVLKEQGNESHGEKKQVFELEESHHEDKHKESESRDEKTVEIEHKVYNHEDLDHKGGETESQSHQKGTNSQVSQFESQNDQKQENDESHQQKNQAQEESTTSQDTNVKSQDQKQQEIESRHQEDGALEGQKTETHEDQYHIKQTISQGVHVQSQDQEHQETKSQESHIEDDKKKAADFKKGESESSNILQSQKEVVIESNESRTGALVHKEHQNENLDLDKSDIKSKGEQKRKFTFPKLTIRKKNETKTRASQTEFQVRKEEASESQFEIHTEKNNVELKNLELQEDKNVVSKVDTQEGMGVLRVDADLKDQEHQGVEHIVTKNDQTIGSHSAAESETITVVNKKKRNRSGSKGTKSFESQDKQATLELENNHYLGSQQSGSKGSNKKTKILDTISSDSVESNEYLGMNRGSYSTNKNFNSQTYTKGQSDYHKRIDQLEDRSFHKKGFKYMSAQGIYIVSTEQTCRKNPCGMNANCRSEEGRAVCFCQFGTFGNPLVSCQPGSCTRNEQCDDHLSCVDGHCMDLCHKSCGINAVCKMRNHQPVCKCLLGYVGNPHVECIYKEICSPNPCGANTVCKSVEGKPVCLCAPGYQGDPLIACRHECEHDTDCARNQACRDFTCQDACVLCGKYADCKSVAVHKPVCQCPKNYYGNPYVACKPECTDHSECPRNKPTCHQFKCKNPCDGACGVLADCAISGVEAVCTCPEHLTGNPLVLCRPYERKDFCEPSPCGMNSRCELGVDDYGKYMAVCNCLPGFYKRNNGACLPGDCEDHFHCPDHKACIDFMCDDPCIGECGTNSFCEPHNHTAVCSCMPGFEGNPVLGCTKQIKCTTQTFCAGRMPMKLLKGK